MDDTANFSLVLCWYTQYPASVAKALDIVREPPFSAIFVNQQPELAVEVPLFILDMPPDARQFRRCVRFDISLFVNNPFNFPNQLLIEYYLTNNRV